MADANQIASNVVNSTVSTFTSINWLAVLGWLLFGSLFIGGCIWVYYYYQDKKIYTKKITAFEASGDYYDPAIRDMAKIVKLGKGGFEILYLKKLKTHKIAYGGKTGKNDYYFFICPDGYWYNSRIGAKINWINASGGLVPVVTTHASMRGQYTSLEKQIDSLNTEKGKFWEKYGSWVFSIVFVLIAGVLMWLMFKEFSSGMSQLAGYHEQMGKILESVGRLAENLNRESVVPNAGGLVKV